MTVAFRFQFSTVVHSVTTYLRTYSYTETRHSRFELYRNTHMALMPNMSTPPKTTQSNAKKEARRTKAHRSGPLPLSPLAPHALSPYVRLTYAAHRSRLSPRGHLAGTGHPATLLATLHPWPPPARRKRLAVCGVNQRRAAGRLAAWAARRQVRRRWRCLAPRAGREAPSLGPGSG